MNEELNQVQETVETQEIVETQEPIYDDAGMFDDYEASEDLPVEDVQEESNEVISEEPTSESEYGLRIKFNGEEKTLTEEEARNLAQKGMNYDRFYEPLDRLARMNGMSVGDYLNRLNDTQVQYEVSREIQNLKTNPKYDGVSDEVLEELASKRVMENIGQQDQNYQNLQREQADAQSARIQRDIDLFFEEYPEFKNKGPEAIDNKVYDYVKKGYTLLEAYNKWSREQSNNPKVLAKEKVSKLNEENKKKSLGNTTNAGSAEADDFLSGLFSD